MGSAQADPSARDANVSFLSHCFYVGGCCVSRKPLSPVENLPLQKTQSASLIPVPDANSVFLSEEVWVGGGIT